MLNDKLTEEWLQKVRLRHSHCFTKWGGEDGDQGIRIPDLSFISRLECRALGSASQDRIPFLSLPPTPRMGGSVESYGLLTSFLEERAPTLFPTWSDIQCLARHWQTAPRRLSLKPCAVGPCDSEAQDLQDHHGVLSNHWTIRFATMGQELSSLGSWALGSRSSLGN